MRIHANILVVAAGLALTRPTMRADEVSDLKAQLQALQEQMGALQQELQQVAEKVQQQQSAQSAAPGGTRAACPTVADRTSRTTQ